MFDFGFLELLVIGLILLLVVGPERLPEVTQAIGSWVRQVRGYLRVINHELGVQSSPQEDESGGRPDPNLGSAALETQQEKRPSDGLDTAPDFPTQTHREGSGIRRGRDSS